MEPSTLNLEEAFSLQRSGQPLGWSLFNETLDTWRPFAVGLDLSLSGLGDDDDSAGDDDDSAGAADTVEVSPDCLGDDDDSAGDDDDSAGDDDDSASPPLGG